MCICMWVMKFIALFIQINNENEKSNGLENILLYGLVDSFHLSDALLTIHNYHALVDSIDEERHFFSIKASIINSVITLIFMHLFF